MSENNKINYVEFPASDLDASKQFFSDVFDWEFTDYGPDYCAFTDSGIDGGFYRSALQPSASQGAPLVVLYSAQLEQTQARVESAGGRVCKPIFAFPGGRRFHFIEPSGNELAVWSDTGE